MSTFTDSSRGRDLYVMQASSGRIKIGRSMDAKRRRHDLESASGQKIALLAVLPGRSSEENAIHRQLASHRGIGEWFQCTKTSQADICAALGIVIVFKYRGEQDLASEKARLANREKLDALRQEEIRLIVRQYVTDKLGHEPTPEWDAAHDAEEAYYDGKDVSPQQVNEMRERAGLPPLAFTRRQLATS